jgi:hypothetical protein
MRKGIIAAISEIDRDMLQGVWAEMCYRLDVCRVMKGGQHTAVIRYAKITWKVSLSVCRSHVTSLSAIEMYLFYEIGQGIMNNPVCTNTISLLAVCEILFLDEFFLG